MTKLLRALTWFGIIGFALLLFDLCRPLWAAQLAPDYVAVQSYSCDGVQRDISFALDYNNATFIRDIDMGFSGETGTRFGTVTLSIAVPPGQQAPFLTGVFGSDTHTMKSYGVNGVYVPAAQALALEFSCTGGGTRTLLTTIFYTSQPGPTP